MAAVCPQRILQEAKDLLDILSSLAVDEETKERIDNNWFELDGLARTLQRDGITKIKED